ncbi:MAG: FG-GAP repeat domain-containing protein, partial [Acidimicrobiia bacterium]
MNQSAFWIRVGAVCALFTTVAQAQFDNNWLTFAPGTGRIKTNTGADATAIITDPQEKDFASGDVNNDGWTDVVMVRKLPFTVAGGFPNYLLMNEGGILVDRSGEYASESDIAGDNGFLTPTNDRDVVLSDVNLDGWLDIITCTTMSDGLPKHISHPRVYINQGAVNGQWQGFRYEDARIPTFPIAPRFCGVDAGDVTGDGAPDLYFADYGGLEDKLLINNGNGFFTDSGTTRMAASMLASGFGTAANIMDMNGDGLNDIVRGQSGSCQISYNNPAQPGYFPTILHQSMGSGATYHSDAGDLNRDNKPDVIISDDGFDNFRLNQGNDSLGRVNWGAFSNFQFVTGGDDGFAGSNHIVDLDGDLWPEAIFADVDVDIGGCDRRTHIYHNLGGAIGGAINMREEAGSAANGNWRGVKGMSSSDHVGTYDIAFLDLDRDGDMDMV